METYYGQHSNESLDWMFAGKSSNISMDEIYGVNFNSSIYQFTIGRYVENTTIIDLALIRLNGLDGSEHMFPRGLLGLSLLYSSEEICGTFFFLWDSGVKLYRLSLNMYAERNQKILVSGFMSLPHQARSFDRFQLFEYYELQDNKKTVMDFSVTSLKLLQKRNTVAEPCIHVDNYDKVRTNFFMYRSIPLCTLQFSVDF
jgi:hypothetical protein